MGDPMFVMGLGNPGTRYQFTRHNAGYRVVDTMMQEKAVVFRHRRFSRIYQSDIPGDEFNRPVSFIRWSGYMNESGGVAGYLRRKYSLAPENLFVVLDNMDLPPGTCRLKTAGGNAGHNGLKSLIRSLGTGSFNRMYIGIGRPKADWSVVDHVLGRPDKIEREAIDGACAKAAMALWELRSSSFERVSEFVNRRVTS